MSSQEEGYRGKHHHQHRDHGDHDSSRQHRKQKDVETKPREKDKTDGKCRIV